MGKHKHCELIKLWADGAEIQLLMGNGKLIDDFYPDWQSIEYRIKPEEKKPVVRWLWAAHSGWISSQLFTEDEAEPMGFPIKLEWSRTEFPA